MKKMIVVLLFAMAGCGGTDGSKSQTQMPTPEQAAAEAKAAWNGASSTQCTSEQLAEESSQKMLLQSKDGSATPASTWTLCCDGTLCYLGYSACLSVCAVHGGVYNYLCRCCL